MRQRLIKTKLFAAKSNRFAWVWIKKFKKKVNKTSKSEIKRITKDNDNLRRELSRIKGLRKYTDDQNATENDGSNKCDSDDLQTANTKLDSLRIHVADVAQTPLSRWWAAKRGICSCNDLPSTAAVPTRHHIQRILPHPGRAAWPRPQGSSDINIHVPHDCDGSTQQRDICTCHRLSTAPTTKETHQWQ